MCGRFTLVVSKSDLERRYRSKQTEIELSPQYNVCPGMMLPVVTYSNSPEILLAKWGLVPSWSTTPTVKFSSINARAETLATSPVYRAPFRLHRCLIPATGFYEWKKEEDGLRQPYYFSLSVPVFSFAGVWDVWKDAEGKEFPSCAIVTCPANAVVETVHPRMPVILNEKDETAWITPNNNIDTLRELLRSNETQDMTVRRVSHSVNNPGNNDKMLIHEDKS